MHHDADMDAGKHAMAGMHDMPADHAMAGMDMPAGHEMGGMHAMMEAHMQAMDSDHDGRITAAEHAAAAQAMFTRADANHDGYLSQDEMKAAHDAMKGAQPPR